MVVNVYQIIFIIEKGRYSKLFVPLADAISVHLMTLKIF